MKQSFEYCVRGVIRKNGKILVCKNKKKDYYFFPGGHVDFGENAEKALIRELKEELDLQVDKLSFIGTVENLFYEKEKIVHEINLVFDVKAKTVKDKSQENHIDFFFFNLKDFSKKRIMPLILRNETVKWLKKKKIFWVSNNEL